MQCFAPSPVTFTLAFCICICIPTVCLHTSHCRCTGVCCNCTDIDTGLYHKRIQKWAEQSQSRAQKGRKKRNHCCAIEYSTVQYSTVLMTLNIEIDLNL